MRTRAFSFVLGLGLSVIAGCVSTRPCDDGLVSGDLGCVPADAGVDTAAEDVGELDTPETSDAGLDSCTTSTFYADMDEDEHGDPSATVEACAMPLGFIALSDDCDDTTELRYPGFTEVCDGIDNDCSTAVDDTFACAVGASTGCTTSCGSTGTGTCSASCTLPAAADCTPPAETCGGAADDDCDGQIDESVQTFGLRRDLVGGGGTTGRVVVVSTTNAYFAFFATPGGIYVQRFDGAGAAVGAAIQVTADATDVFDAYATASRMVVAWVNSGDLLRAAVLDDTLAVLTSARDIISVDAAFTTRLSVVRSSIGATLFMYHDGTSIRAVARTSNLSGSAPTFSVTSTPRADFESTLDGTGGRAYVAYVTSSNAIQVVSLLVSGTLEGVVATLTSANPRRAPVPHFAVPSAGPERVGVTFHENPTGTTSDLIRLAIFEVGAGGALTIRDTVTLHSGAAPDGVPDPTQITYGGGRWFVPYLRMGSPATSSTWWLAEVTEFASGAPRVDQTAVEAGTSANRSVGASANLTLLGYGPAVFLAASRTDGVGRGYLLSCP
jgi:hypothetical protein